MARAHYWLLLRLAKAPKVFTYGTGVLIAVVLILAAAISVFVVDKANTTRQHNKAVSLAQAMSQESTQLLEHFVQYKDTECTADNLKHLNMYLLRARFVREVGILDADSRLLCTTTIGLLPQPVKGNYPVIKLPSNREILVDVPLQIANKAVKATIVRQGDFNVVIGPHVTEELYTSADEVWLRTVTGLSLIRSMKNPLVSLPHEIPGFNNAVDQSVWSWHFLGYTQFTAPPDSPFVFQTRRSWGSVMQQNSSLLAGLLIGAIVFAALAASALVPHIMRLSNVQYRVRFLCDEDHIQLVYQPIFDLATNQPVGCEVLMRIHEEGRVWMPDQLIPSILRLGLHCHYDHVVARKAIAELASQLPVQKEHFKVALNFFPESIDCATLIPELQGAMQSAARSDMQLCIEITEHSLSSRLIAQTNGLRAQGFLIAIDDFGTGYSNLKSVTTLSPDLLKIDKSFVFDLEDLTLRSTLIPQIVSIGRAIDAQIIAEGIEKLEQVPLLAAMGVQYGQGYALGRPMSLQAFVAFISQHQA